MSLSMIAPRFGPPDVLEPLDVTVPPPGPGEVTIDVRAVGVNMSDVLAIGGVLANPTLLPRHPVGYEVAGIIAAIGPDTQIASGGGETGDPVLAFRVVGGYAERLNVPAVDVYHKPDVLSFPEAANLLLPATTASKLLRVTEVKARDVVLVHGASGATGVSVLQQAAVLGARVIGTCSRENFALVKRFGGEPVTYGEGLEERVRELAPDGVHVALDCVGTDEALDVSFALVANRRRVMTTAAYPRALAEDMELMIGTYPAESERAARGRLIDMAAQGRLVVPIVQTYPLARAAEALNFLAQGHPGGGKLALIP
ncbi:zinc-binding alcohol dehydrogenase family protein [Streptomyces sp. NPDC002701]|uniref:quinone oxidoreductase family protein n=1 Tax=Streptomyces sp. NPDC002701 TaxID=3364661 RepID=UPI0036AF0A32